MFKVSNPRDPSRQKIPAWGPKGCRYYLHWAVWILSVKRKSNRRAYFVQTLNHRPVLNQEVLTSPADIQLVLVPFIEASRAEERELMVAAENGYARHTDTILNRPQKLGSTLNHVGIYRDIPPNQMEKKMENEMDTGRI